MHRYFFDKILYISQSVYDYLKSIKVSDERLFCMYDSVKVSELNSTESSFRREFGIQQDAIVIGTFTSLYRKKGVYDFAMCAKEILKEHKDAYIIFGGEIEQDVKDEIQKMFDESVNIIFTDFRKVKIMSYFFNNELALIDILKSENKLLHNAFDSNVKVELHDDRIRFYQQTDLIKHNFMSDNFKNINEYVFNIKNNDIQIKILNSMRIKYNITDIEFKIYKISSKNFNNSKKIRYKILLPCSQKIDYIQHYNLFECLGFININNKKIKFILFPIADYEFRLYSIDGDHIVIDCETEIDFETFEKYYKIILTAYCFIVGFAPISKGYIFGYEHNSYEYESFVYDTNAFAEYNSKLRIIDTNIYRYSKDINIQNDIYDKLKRISKESISKLTNSMINNQKFYDAMCIMFDINKIGNFGRSTASLYAIWLEMITSIVCDDNKIKEDIKNKQEKVKLQKQLDNVAQDYYNKNMPDEKYENSVIQKRINAILQPTNMDKLKNHLIYLI